MSSDASGHVETMRMSMRRRGSLFVVSALGLLVAYGCGGGDSGDSGFPGDKKLDTAPIPPDETGQFGPPGTTGPAPEAGTSLPGCGN